MKELIAIILSFAQFDLQYNRLCRICHGQFKDVCTNFAVKKVMIETSLREFGSRNNKNPTTDL